MKRPAPGSPQEWAVGLLALAVISALAFSAGRFSAPEQVQTVDVERVVYRDKVVTVQGKTETRIVYRDRIVSPDGTVREKSEERTATREDLERTATRAGETEKKSESKTTLRPDWRVSVLAGAQLGGTKPALELNGPLVLGAQIERRIIGGVSIGVWGTTSGALGGSLSAEF